MEEEFKKKLEELGEGEGSLLMAGNGGLEKVGEVLDDVLDGGSQDLEEGIMEDLVLDGGFGGLKMDGVPSWEAVREMEDGCILEKVQDVGMGEENLEVDVSGEAGEEEGAASKAEAFCAKTGEISGGMLKETGEAEVVVKKKVLLNWKMAVFGGGEGVKAGDATNVLGEKREAGKNGIVV